MFAIRDHNPSTPARVNNFFVYVACCMTMYCLAGCSTESVVTGLYENRKYVGDNLSRPLKVSQAKDTFLLKSSDIFYPDGMPPDPAMLPELSPERLNQLEGLLDRVSRRVDRTLDAHRDLLLKHDTDLNLDAASVRISVLNQGASVAGTDETGALYLDVKVVQAVYRSALLATLVNDDGDRGFQYSSYFGGEAGLERAEEMTKEQLAFAEFEAFRNQLREVSPVLLFSDLGAFREGAGSDELGKDAGFSDQIFMGAISLFEQRMKDELLMGQSQALERAFLGSLEFLVAHEDSHISLNHFPLTTECEEAQFREFEADINAVLINTLAQFDNAPSFTIRVSDGGGRQFEGAWSWNPTPTHLLFFTHAYELAEFDSTFGHIRDCEYTEAERRAVGAHVFAKMLYEVLEHARYADTMRRSRDRTIRKLVGENPFQNAFEELLENAADDQSLPKSDFILANRDVLSDLYHTYYRARN